MSVNKRFVATTGVPAEAVIGKRIEEVILGIARAGAGALRAAIRDKAIVRWEETSDYPTGRLTGGVASLPARRARPLHLPGRRRARSPPETRGRAAGPGGAYAPIKLESIGRLAGGVAHDFNNVLTVILGYGELMRAQVKDGHPARPRLEQVILAAHRAAGLTRQLLAFSRKQVMQPKLLDLGAVVGDMRRMLDRVVGEDLEIAVVAAERLAAVQADPTQIEQVIMNLVVNARDAMPKGGRVTIETGERGPRQRVRRRPSARPIGPLRDAGGLGYGRRHGRAETQQRIFEAPSSPQGRRGEGGHRPRHRLWHREPDGWRHPGLQRSGPRHVLQDLPAARGGEAVAVETQPRGGPSAGDETVLVVEDSESLRDLIQELLTGATPSRTTRSERRWPSSRKANTPSTWSDRRRHAEARWRRPREAGRDPARSASSTCRATQQGPFRGRGVLDRSAILLEKPFTADQLARAVRLALDRRG